MAYVCACGRAFDLAAALDALPRNGSSRSAMVQTRCAGCNSAIELRLRNGGYDVGYSYAGGSLHFEPVKKVRVAGLAIKPGEPDALDVTLGERRWHFAVDTPSRQRFAVLPNAWCAERPLDALDFAQWQVQVEAVERAQASLAPRKDWVLQRGDFLHLRGAAPALTAAWHYMNSGVDRKPAK